jgi:DNA-binding PadR family transcriptional regulator
MKFSMSSPSIRILQLLRDSATPLTYRTISYYILKLGFDRRSIHNFLRRAEKNELINSNGPRRLKLYNISSKGLDILHNFEIRKDLDTINNYFLKNPGAD